MKSDREFLEGMWEKVSQTEYEEIQMKAAKIRHKRILIKNIAVVFSIFVLFAFFIIVKPIYEQSAIYIISAVFLTMAYWLDKYISGERKDKNIEGEIHEN